MKVGFLAGGAAAGLLALPGCASMDGRYRLVDAIRRLLMLSADNAFYKLTAPDGFWNSAVARSDQHHIPALALDEDLR